MHKHQDQQDLATFTQRAIGSCPTLLPTRSEKSKNFPPLSLKLNAENHHKSLLFRVHLITQPLRIPLWDSIWLPQTHGASCLNTNSKHQFAWPSFPGLKRDEQAGSSGYVSTGPLSFLAKKEGCHVNEGTSRKLSRMDVWHGCPGDHCGHHGPCLGVPTDAGLPLCAD